MLKRDVKIMGVYLDYNASAPIDERVLEYMINVYGIILEMQTVEHMIMGILLGK